MDYNIVTKIDYELNREKYLKLIKELYEDDDSKLTNIGDTIEHLNFIFENTNNDSFLILGIEDGKLVSMVNFLEYNNIEKKWCLFLLFTLKSKRRQGYGEKILKKGIDEIKKKCAKHLISGIEENNVSSIKLHEKIGFRYSGKSWDELAEGFPEGHLGYILEF